MRGEGPRKGDLRCFEEVGLSNTLPSVPSGTSVLLCGRYSCRMQTRSDTIVNTPAALYLMPGRLDGPFSQRGSMRKIFREICDR